MELELPYILDQMITSAASAAAPVSMLMTGVVISEFSLRELLKDRSAYIVSFVKLLLLPLTICFILSRFLPEETVAIATLLYSIPCGLNTIIFAKLKGQDCKSGASLALISTAFSIITIPICMEAVALFCA